MAALPSKITTNTPTNISSGAPSSIPSNTPSILPSISSRVSNNPSVTPSNIPNNIPSNISSNKPSNEPSYNGHTSTTTSSTDIINISGIETTENNSKLNNSTNNDHGRVMILIVSSISICLSIICCINYCLFKLVKGHTQRQKLSQARDEQSRNAQKNNRGGSLSRDEMMIENINQNNVQLSEKKSHSVDVIGTNSTDNLGGGNKATNLAIVAQPSEVAYDKGIVIGNTAGMNTNEVQDNNDNNNHLNDDDSEVGDGIEDWEDLMYNSINQRHGTLTGRELGRTPCGPIGKTRSLTKSKRRSSSRKLDNDSKIKAKTLCIFESSVFSHDVNGISKRKGPGNIHFRTSSATQSITLIMREGDFCVDNTTIISLTLSGGYILTEYSHSGCTGCIVDSDGFYDVGCDVIDTNTSDSWTVYKNILITVAQIETAPTAAVHDGEYSSSSYGFDSFFILGVYPEGTCSYYTFDVASSGSCHFICEGSGSNRQGMMYRYTGTSDRSGGHAKLNVDFYDYSDTQFSIACDTLLLDGNYHPGSYDCNTPYPQTIEPISTDLECYFNNTLIGLTETEYIYDIYSNFDHTGSNESSLGAIFFDFGCSNFSNNALESWSVGKDILTTTALTTTEAQTTQDDSSGATTTEKDDSYDSVAGKETNDSGFGGQYYIKPKKVFKKMKYQRVYNVD